MELDEMARQADGDDWLNEVDIAELFQHVEPSAPAFPEEEDEEDGDIFETHQICYFEEEKLLVCLRCNIVMTKGFARHLSRVHQETINERAKEELLAICFSSVSMYFQQNRELLSAITWLPVHDGYACLGCAYYCKKKREMKTHCRNEHQVADGFYAVKVQTLPGALPIRYFGVHQPALLDDEQEMVIQRAIALVSQDRVMPETLQQRNPLYDPSR